MIGSIIQKELADNYTYEIEKDEDAYIIIIIKKYNGNDFITITDKSDPILSENLNEENIKKQVHLCIENIEIFLNESRK